MSNNTQKQQNDTIVSYGKNVVSNKLEPAKLSEVLTTIRTGDGGIRESIEKSFLLDYQNLLFVVDEYEIDSICNLFC